MKTPIRVLVAKCGLDGHDRGIKVVASALRDAGMEVIYTGLRQTPESIVATAIEEDVDAIGISSLSGAHMTLFSSLIELLNQKKIDNVVLIGGGVIPNKDIKALKKKGVEQVFVPGSDLKEIVDSIVLSVQKKRPFKFQ